MKSTKVRVQKEARKPAEDSLPPVPVAAEAPGRLAFALNHWWKYLLGAAALFIFAFEIYGPALNAPFVFDDIYLPFMHPDMAGKPLRAWMNVRPLTMASYHWNYRQAGTEPYWYHWLNVFLHCVNSALVYMIVRRFLSWVNEKPHFREILSVFAALLFCLHPVQTESVAYVTSRSEVLSVFFFLAATAVFLYRRTAAISMQAVVAVLLFFAAAVLSKEHTVVLPVFLLLTDFYWNPGFRFAGIRANWKLYAPLAAGGVLAFGFVWRIVTTSDSAGFRLKDMQWYEYLFTQFRALVHYILLYIAPIGQNVDHEFPLSRTVFDRGSIVYLAILLALAIAAWRYRREYKLASYGYFGFLLLMAPTSSIVPIQDVFVERRLYLPFLCLVLVTVDLVRRWRTARMTLGTALGAILVVFSGMAYGRAQLWSSPIELWRDSVSKSPAKFRPNFQLAYALYSGGRCQEALPYYEAAARQGTPDYRTLTDWGLAADCAGQSEVAIARLRQAAQLENLAHVHATMGMVYAKQGKTREAFDELLEAERLDPKFLMTYVYRGNLHMMAGSPSKAAVEYRRAMAIDPGNETARESLANAQRQLGTKR